MLVSTQIWSGWLPPTNTCNDASLCGKSHMIKQANAPRSRASASPQQACSPLQEIHRVQRFLYIIPCCGCLQAALCQGYTPTDPMTLEMYLSKLLGAPFLPSGARPPRNSLGASCRLSCRAGGGHGDGRGSPLIHEHAQHTGWCEG